VVSISDAVKACLTPNEAHVTVPDTWKRFYMPGALKNGKWGVVIYPVHRNGNPTATDYHTAHCLPYSQMFDIIHGMPMKTRAWTGWKYVRDFLNVCMNGEESAYENRTDMLSLRELAEISNELTLQSQEIKRMQNAENIEPTRNIRTLFQHFASVEVDQVLPRFISSYMKGNDTYPISQEHVYRQLVGCVMDMHMRDKSIAQLNTQTPRSPPYPPPTNAMPKLVRTLSVRFPNPSTTAKKSNHLMPPPPAPIRVTVTPPAPLPPLPPLVPFDLSCLIPDQSAFHEKPKKNVKRKLELDDDSLAAYEA